MSNALQQLLTLKHLFMQKLLSILSRLFFMHSQKDPEKCVYCGSSNLELARGLSIKCLDCRKIQPHIKFTAEEIGQIEQQKKSQTHV